jgi:AhpD family alkylhydroperoxidase
MIDICYDAQTSGGLLIAIAESCAEKFLKALHKACPEASLSRAKPRDRGKEVSAATVIGRVLGKGSGIVHIKTSGKRKIPSRGTTDDGRWTRDERRATTGGEVPCCADAVTAAPVTAGGPGSAGPERQPGAAEASGTAQVEAKFKDFLSSAGSPHGLDAYTKQAIAIALSVAMRCEACLKMHLKKAKEKGFTQDEIDEAAWMGISFGGSPTMVFYEQNKNS